MRPEFQAHVDELLEKYKTMRDQLGETQRQIAAVTATATSPDGNVQVTVGHRGELVSMKLRPQIYRSPDAERLAELIVATSREAVREAQKKLHDILQPLLPAELAELSSLPGDPDVSAFLPPDLSAMTRLTRPR